jgi:CBS domain containing-hemolysin-like protein
VGRLARERGEHAQRGFDARHRARRRGQAPPGRLPLSEPVALDFFGVAWRLGATLFFVLLNGFFVAAEFALVKVRSSRIEQLARDGSRSARLARHILAHLDRYLSGCQLGITLASLALGALGEPAVSRLLLAAAGALGITVAPGAMWLPVLSFTLAFAVITTLHMTLGEQAPKMWALRHAETGALRSALLLRAFTFAFGPFISAINAISNGILRLVGLPPDAELEPSHTADEIRSILLLSARHGHITQRAQELSENVLRMIDLEVRHIIVPRVDVDYLSLEWPFEECVRVVRATNHTRYPLCERGLDTIVGFVNARDVREAVLEGERPDLRKLAREPVFVTETMPLSDFLLELQRRRSHCAAVVDERGTVIGLAFREDALEEIVGPLGDEFDEEQPELTELAPGVYELSGRMSLPEVCDRLDFELDWEEEEEADTIGGHVTARLGRLPRRGDTVEVGPYRATVLEVARRRVQRLRLERIEPLPEDVEREAS